MDLRNHEAWSPPAENRILLMAGSTTKWVPSGEPGFPLKHLASGSCLINEGETFILFGGYPGGYSGKYDNDNWPKTSRGNVDRYSIDGHLESLPNLGLWLIGHAHGCGSYTNGEGRKVLMVSGKLTLLWTRPRARRPTSWTGVWRRQKFLARKRWRTSSTENNGNQDQLNTFLCQFQSSDIKERPHFFLREYLGTFPNLGGGWSSQFPK